MFRITSCPCLLPSPWTLLLSLIARADMKWRLTNVALCRSNACVLLREKCEQVGERWWQAWIDLNTYDLRIKIHLLPQNVQRTRLTCFRKILLLLMIKRNWLINRMEKKYIILFSVLMCQIYVQDCDLNKECPEVFCRKFRLMYGRFEDDMVKNYCMLQDSKP